MRGESFRGLSSHGEILNFQIPTRWKGKSLASPSRVKVTSKSSPSIIPVKVPQQPAIVKAIERISMARGGKTVGYKENGGRVGNRQLPAKRGE